MRFRIGRTTMYQGVAAPRDWIQINRADASEYEKDLELFQASIEFVKAAGAR